MKRKALKVGLLKACGSASGWRYLDEFDESDEESPGVGPVHNQSFQQDPDTKLCLLTTKNTAEGSNC